MKPKQVFVGIIWIVILLAGGNYVYNRCSRTVRAVKEGGNAPVQSIKTIEFHQARREARIDVNLTLTDGGRRVKVTVVRKGDDRFNVRLNSGTTTIKSGPTTVKVKIDSQKTLNLFDQRADSVVLPVTR